MLKFKVFFKKTDIGQTLTETVHAMNHIDAENTIATKHNIPYSRVIMSKNMKSGKLHSP